VGLEQWPEKKKIKLEEEVISEILVAEPTQNQVLKLAMLKTILRKKKNSSSSKPQQKLP